MRSRYSAYVLGLENYLLATWHISTRPASLGLADQSPQPAWLGLTVKRHENPTAETAVVEFVARMRIGVAAPTACTKSVVSCVRMGAGITLMAW